MERRITRVGNSVGITLPSDLLKEAGLSQGDDVKLELKNGKITMSKKEQLVLPDGVDSDFMNLLTDVIKEHDEAFKGLVER